MIRKITALSWAAGLLALSLSAPAFGQANQKPPAKPGRNPPTADRLQRRQPAKARPQPRPAQNTRGAAQKKPADADREPPGAAGPLPTTMDKIAQAADVPYRPKPAGHKVKFNLQDADLAELVNHISGLTGKRFIYGAKVRQIKATVVSPEPVTLAEAYEAFLSILEVNGMTVVPHGRFLKIVDSAGVVTQDTPIYSRGAPVPNADRFVTRLYRLKYASPDETAALLNKFKSKEGDITVYTPGRLLVITDTGSQVQRLMRIIEEIDVGGAGQSMWIEPVHYGNAADLAEQINELFEVGGEGKGGAGEDGTSGLGKVVADDATNSLVIVGNEDAYLRLLELMKRLDTRPTEMGKVRVLALQHAVAEELANTLNAMLSGQTTRATPQRGGRGAQAAAGAGDGGGMFEGAIHVTPDKATNSLIITSSGRDYAQLRLVIDDLDKPRRQVFIEAVIMDLSVSDTTNLGIAWHGGGQVDVGGGEQSLILGGFEAGRSLIFPADPNALQGLAAGIRGPEIEGTSNLLGTGLSIPAFGVVINALAQSGKSNVLATPHVIATDNVPAEINIGENIPLQTNVGGISNIGALAGQLGGAQAGAGNLAALGALGGFGFSAPRQDVGNRIRVTPHINDSDMVRLEIEQESSAPGAPLGALGAIPITRRTANTTVVVADQQTVVIGGLMRDEYVHQRDKVPVLGDLPVLGFLFRRTRTEKRKTNLLLVLTPHVIRDQSDLRKIFIRKMRERQEFLDRYFVFSREDWEPPLDYERTNGLVEDIRQARFEIQERIRLEEESQPSEILEHEPSDPIELPQVIKAGSSGKKQPAPPRGNRQQLRRRNNTRERRRPPRPSSQVETSQQGRVVAQAEASTPPTSPIRVNPISRSVNAERVE